MYNSPLGQPNNIVAPKNAQQVGQSAKIELDLMEDKMYREHMEWLSKTKSYRQAYDEISHMNPDSFSFTRATFTIENAYLDNKLSYDKFVSAVKLKADVVRQLLKKEHLSTKDNLALNYGIQQLYQQPQTYYDSKTKRMALLSPFKYDFNDYNGSKDLTQTFTAKMLWSGKGQCQSMPEVYLMLIEQLGAKAWLSLAPQHFYILFANKAGRLLSFETTNGNVVSNTWAAQSGFINAKAVKNNSYLDTLSKRQLYAQCLDNLLFGYLRKFDYDDFAEAVKQKILQIDSSNMRALIIDAQIKQMIALRKIDAAGRPKEGDLPKYPEAYKAYLEMRAAVDKVDNLGYQDMPEEAYQRWLRSIEQEKKRQGTREIQERLQREINTLKQMKSTLQPNKKN